MSEHHWIRITPCENVPPREGRAVRIGEREIALFNLGDSFLATDNRCPHQGGPLCDGIVLVALPRSEGAGRTRTVATNVEAAA